MVPGTVHQPSTTGALAEAVAALAPAGWAVETSGAVGHLPLFSPRADVSEQVADWQAQMESADAVVICTPEYAYGMPGALKNALDWLVASGSLYRRRVGAISLSPTERGGDRALAGLCQTLTALDADVPEAAALSVPFVRQSLQDGRLADAEAGRVRQMWGALGAGALEG